MNESFVDWRGKIVATIFTYGCNFRCPFCHNYSLVTQKVNGFLNPNEILDKIKELKGWIDGVCITGGEPTIHKDLPEFVKELSKILPVKVDTNGSHPEILESLIPYASYVAMDIKAPKGKYSKLAGRMVNIDKIEESIGIIKFKARDYEFRTTAVPVLTMEDFEDIAYWIKGAKRYIIQQFSAEGGTLVPDFRSMHPIDIGELKRICERIEHNFGECILANL